MLIQHFSDIEVPGYSYACVCGEHFTNLAMTSSCALIVTGKKKQTLKQNDIPALFVSIRF